MTKVPDWAGHAEALLLRELLREEIKCREHDLAEADAIVADRFGCEVGVKSLAAEQAIERHGIRSKGDASRDQFLWLSCPPISDHARLEGGCSKVIAHLTRLLAETRALIQVPG